MPYRRLPTTDQSRLRALHTAIDAANRAGFNEKVIDYKLQSDAQRFLQRYEMQVIQYHQNFENRVSANKKYRHAVQNARMYISHFIQVLNLAIIRGDIKKDHIALYGLDEEYRSLPDLSSEEDLLVWGENIIKGEQERTKMGGFPIYNPTISKVKVFFDIFKDLQYPQQQHIINTNRNYGDLTDLRKEADGIILQIWNAVEAYYANRLPYDRFKCCQNYGVVYYFRTGEKHLTPETDKEILRVRAMTPPLPLTDETE